MITLLDVYQTIHVSKKYYNLISIDLTKQQKLDAAPKATQQINFTRNLNRAEDATMFFIIEEAKETVQIFQKEQLTYTEFVLFLYSINIK